MVFAENWWCTLAANGHDSQIKDNKSVQYDYEFGHASVILEEAYSAGVRGYTFNCQPPRNSCATDMRANSLDLAEESWQTACTSPHSSLFPPRSCVEWIISCHACVS
ncbi:unnamed protein product [Onchocerca flexuosa]|uniref:SCP domain-containing protein n=1 Tax=Onchocerca flexuosa TaxID=387005 RepID=A0A183I0Q6_9BILA|nr:unnamed protein product [Onchocerca flexuosa]